MKRWTKKDLKRLRRLYPNNPGRLIARLMKRRYESVKSKAATLGLLKDSSFNKGDHLPQALTPKEKKFLKNNYTKYTNHRLAQLVGRSESAIQACRKSFGLTKPNEGRYKKGAVPLNKGKKMPPGWGGAGIKTRFKKGQKPRNTKYNGAICTRIMKGRFQKWIRIKNNKWEELNRYNYRKHIGPIPTGMNVSYKDGDPLNCEPANLFLITRQDLMLRNTIHRYPAEVKSAIRMVGKLKRKIMEYEEQD